MNRDIKQELDRRTWATIKRIGFDLVARGHGEHRMEEPIYFGRAFTSAPVFTYSLTTGTDDDPITPFFVVPPSDLVDVSPDGNGRYPHSMGVNYAIQDPGFEVQGQWVTYGVTDAVVIPDVHAHRADGTFRQQLIRKNWTTDTTYRQPWDSNMWIQTVDSNNRWSISSDKSHDLGFGYPGKYSAKYVFGSETSSNWLIPTENFAGDQGLWNYWTDDWAGDEWCWNTTSGQSVLVTSWYTEGSVLAEPPPVFAGWKGFAHVWSDDDCELEIFTGAVAESQYVDVGEVVHNEGYDAITLFDVSSSTQLVRGNEWTRVDFFHPYENETGMYPNTPVTTDGYIGWLGWQYRVRVNNGLPGQIVHLDNLYMWQDMRNYTTPIVTIGVDEWAIDEYGAYVGAKLWFKVTK